VVLSIEPYVKSAVHSAESFLQLKRRVGSGALRINLDVTNFYDLRDLIDPGPICREIIPLLAGHVGLVHIKEIRLEEGFHIHAGLAPITAGPTDWRLVLELAAQAAPPDCWVLLEHLSSREEARASVAHLRSLAADAGVSLA
jgi:sugar phosphate isomerase/epimerase